MKFKDYYNILGVSRDASVDEIKKAYKKLAHQYHPDISKDPSGEEKFKEIGEAYSTLKDSEKRAAYDQLGSHSSGQDFTPPPNWRQHFTQENASFDDLDLSDLFAGFSRNQAHGRHSANKHPIPGQDYELSINISLEEAFHGSTMDLHFEVQEYDTNGQLKRVPHAFKARIPKGVTNGQKLLLRGKGGKGFNGGPDGHLYLNINFKPHKYFRVNDYDLFIEVPITPWEAILGATIKIPTLDNPINLKIPPGSDSGQRLRISKRGMPRKQADSGDLFAILQIHVPKNPNEKEKALINELANASTFNPRSDFD